MIVVVTPNPAVDVTYRVARQAIGVTQRVTGVDRRPGGKGINVARVLGQVGVDALAVSPLGGPAGVWTAEALDALGVRHHDVAVPGETRTTVTVVDDASHPTMYGEPGPLTTAEDWRAVATAVRAELSHASALVVSGSLPPRTDPDVVAEWIADARRSDVPSVVDCSGPALLAAARAGATVCKPNLEELLDATGAGTEAGAARTLLDLGAEVVVVSHGADGITAWTRSTSAHQPAVPGVTGNPTGAGDAATAGLVQVLARVRPRRGELPLTTVREALQQAAAHGAAAVLRPVAGEVDPAALERFVGALAAGTRPGPEQRTPAPLDPATPLRPPTDHGTRS